MILQTTGSWPHSLYQRCSMMFWLSIFCISTLLPGNILNHYNICYQLYYLYKDISVEVVEIAAMVPAFGVAQIDFRSDSLDHWIVYALEMISHSLIPIWGVNLSGYGVVYSYTASTIFGSALIGAVGLRHKSWSLSQQVTCSKFSSKCAPNPKVFNIIYCR